MTRRHFRTRAELERKMDAARQLRAETVATWIGSAVPPTVGVIRRVVLLITAHAPRRASSPRVTVI